MMYNRYVPDAAGVYRPTRVEDVPPPPPVQPPAPPPVPEAPPEPPAPCPPLPVRQDAGGLLSRLLPRSIDTGDLLMLLILPPMLKLTGVWLATPVAQVITFVIAWAAKRRVDVNI